MSDDDTAAHPFATQRLFGLDFVSTATIDEVAAWLAAAGDEHPPAWRCVVTPNVDHLIRYDRNPDEAAVATSSFIVLPDGTPVLWAGKLLGRPLANRLTGSDLFPRWWARVSAAGTPVVVVAPTQKVADGLAAEHPGASFVVPGVVDVGDQPAVDALIDSIGSACERSGARFCVVGLSMAKHHLVAARLRERWAADYRDAPIVMLLGASPEMHLGLIRRAPEIVQRLGFEWLFRFAQEPKRLFKRYFVDDLRFVSIVIAERRAIRRRRDAADADAQRSSTASIVARR